MKIEMQESTIDSFTKLIYSLRVNCLTNIDFFTV